MGRGRTEAREKDRLRGSTGRQGRRRTEQRLYEGDTNTKWNQTPGDRGSGGGGAKGEEGVSRAPLHF